LERSGWSVVGRGLADHQQQRSNRLSSASEGALVLKSVTIWPPSLPIGLYASRIPSEMSENFQLVIRWRENLYLSRDHNPSSGVGS